MAIWGTCMTIYDNDTFHLSDITLTYDIVTQLDLITEFDVIGPQSLCKRGFLWCFCVVMLLFGFFSSDVRASVIGMSQISSNQPQNTDLVEDV